VNYRRLASLALVVGAIICGLMGADVFGVRISQVKKSAPSVVNIPTALWSIRRAPQPLIDAVGSLRLKSSLDSLLAGTNSCFIVNEGNALRAQGNPDAVLIPASTMKMFTAAAALNALGADAHFDTVAKVSGSEVSPSVPNLYLLGGGDPLLGTTTFRETLDKFAATRGAPITSLEKLADQIKSSGVKKVSEGIIVDDSRYDTTRFVTGWKDSYRSDGQIGPIGALTVNRGFAQDAVAPVDDPALFAAETLEKLLEERGVAVSGSAKRGRVPESSTSVGSVSSVPLSEIVEEMIRSSDNLAAEMITRELGLKVKNEGTTAAGVAAISDELKSLGVDVSQLSFFDGSGLGRSNRASCQSLVKVINTGERSGFSALWSGLPIAGETGTLTNQLKDTPLAGHLKAKTGSLAGVTGLTGLIDVRRPLRFSLLINGEFTEAGGVDLRSQAAQIIGAFPDAPGIDVLSPIPAGT